MSMDALMMNHSVPRKPLADSVNNNNNNNKNNNSNNLIYITPACRMTSEALLQNIALMSNDGNTTQTRKLCYIAKMTAQCALYTAAVKICGTP